MQTRRLTIRPIEEADWRGIQAIWEDFNRSEYAIYDRFKDTSSAAVQSRVERWASATRSGGGHAFLAVCLEGELIGFASLNIRPEGYELGYGFLGKCHGNGYARESLSAILDAVERAGVRKVFAGTALKNLPSVRLLRSLGFELTGTETLSFHKDRQGNDIAFEGGIFEKRLHPAEG